ncbi:hypothetical protein [uncultured Eubacterium sp.]|uniref:hypothetical protein n=1 Tax=uncultured Eubacterium sp. TaxID=165185 RepID=UPI0025DDD4B5|nr:hypothetical protein [uncultured Eubacterium sp.]
MKKFIKKTIAGLIAGVMAVSSMPFAALAADETPEITGAIKYSSVIFTHGTNTVSTDYNFMMKGTQIASGDVKSATDCKTTVSVANGVTINSVSCVEDSNAQLSVSNNVLTGNFGSNHDDSTVTLKTNVTYNGKSYVSYNKVYVDTIPVPAHAASISQRYYGISNPLKIIMAYSQTLKGSLGQTSSNGSSDSNSVSANAKELFVPGTQVRYDNKNDTNHWRLTNNISIDKVAGQTGYKNSGGIGTGTTILTTTAPTGYYYFDKSTTDNYGFSAQNGSSFTFDLVTIPFNIVTGDNASGGNVNLDTHTLTGSNFTQTDPYSTFSYDSDTGVPSTKIFTNKITGDASSITNGTMTGSYELRFANGSNNVWGVNITKSNWNVYVADKSAARNPYNTANSSIKTSDVYTDESWNAYKTAYLNDEEFLSNYKNVTLGTVQNTATNLGSALTTAYNNLEVKKYTYTFIKADGSQTTVEAENDVKALEANKTPNTASTQKTYAGENQHKWTEYTWPATATNYTFTEQATEKSEACNVVDNKCTECGNVFLDLDAWNDAAKEHVTITINDISKYTNDSMDEYKALANEAIALRNRATTQEDVDKATAMLLSAQTVLRKKSVTVTFVYDNDGNEATHETKTVSYGETYDAVSDKNVEKWTVSTDNGATTTRLNTYDKTVSIVVTKDVVIKAYQTNEEQTEDSSKVTFYGKNNVVVAVRYVAKGTPLETNTVGVPEIPFYNKGKWDKETVTGTGSDISVKAVYETTQAEDKLCGVHYDGFEGGVKKYSYDSYVYLTGADTTKKYALYSDAEHTKLLTILNGIDFYAPKTDNIYVGEYTGEDKASIGITGSFNKRTETTKSAVYNCKFYLPEGATVVEYGLEVTLNGKTARVKAESKSERNEYSISLNAPITATSITAVDGRAYVTYTLNGKTTTIYSETVNQAL